MSAFIHFGPRITLIAFMGFALIIINIHHHQHHHHHHQHYQGSTKKLAALALLADKLKSHGQILTKITYILSRLCMENVGKGI